MEFSGLVALQVDALGRPTGLEAMTDGDVILSSILTTNVRDAVSGIDGVSATVYDNSSSWGGGGGGSLEASVVALNVFSGSVETSTTVLDVSVDALNVFSGSVETSTTTLDASVGALNVWSGTVDVSTGVLDASVVALNVFSGSVETSTTTLDASVDALNVFSGSVETSTTTLDASVGALNVWSGTVDVSTGVLDASVVALNVFSGSVETSTTTLDASVDALNVFSGSVETSTTTLDASVVALNVFSGSVETSTAGIKGASGTAWLTGATPTLSNDLNVNEKNIIGVESISFGPTAGSYDISGTGSLVIKSSTGDVTVSANRHAIVSATQDTRLVCGATNDIQYGPVAGNLSSLIDNMTNLASVSGGGGGFEACAIASAIYVGLPDGSAITVSGATPGEVIHTVGDDYVLSIDTAAQRAKWTPAPFVLGGDLQNINFSNEVESDATIAITGAAMLIRDIVVGTSLSSGPDSNITFDRSVTASSLTVLSSLSGSPDCDAVFSNNVSIENTNTSPPSNPVALVLKTIDASPVNETAIGEIRFSGNNDAPANKVYNRLRGVSNDVGAGSEDGSIQLRHLLAGSEVISLIASGGGVTVEESLTVSTCPVPAPVCYAQMDGDGTAAASETKFGAGVTPTTVQDSTGHITWDNTNKEFDISVAGTYHVTATLVLNVGTTTLTTIRVKNGATAKNTYTDHGTHAAEDPEEVTIQAAFTCAASDSITVTFQDDAATNINLMAGSSVTVRRLF